MRCSIRRTIRARTISWGLLGWFIAATARFRFSALIAAICHMLYRDWLGFGIM